MTKFNYQGVVGPDVSFYQDAPDTPQQIDFGKMKAAGAAFVIIRAGQNTWPDPDLSYNYIEAAKAGLPRGLYWFYDSRVSPVAQAMLCLSLFDPKDYPEIGIWADFEENYGGQYKGWRNWKIFLNTLRSKTTGVVGIYTAPSYWKVNRPTNAAELAFFKMFPLWIANYGVSEPEIPAPWEFAVLWQYGTPAVGLEYGVESLEIDMNKWHGSRESFKAFFGLTDTGTGVTMRYEAVSIYPMSLRPDHYTDNTPIRSIPAQSRMQSDAALYVAPGEKWLYVTHLSGVPLATPGWVAIVSAYRVYCSLMDNGAPPSEPPQVFPAEIGLTIGAVTKTYILKP